MEVMEIHGEDLFTELPFGILREIFPHVPHALHVKALRLEIRELVMCALYVHLLNPGSNDRE